MSRKLKPWEIALFAGVCIALLSGAYLNREQAELADNVIRLHVLANSDKQADQQLKLLVRDRILVEAEGLYRPGDDVQAAYRRIEDALPSLAATGQQVVEEQDETLVDKLAPVFFGNREMVAEFLGRIKGARPTDVTAEVNRLLKDRKVSDISCNKVLWELLHENGYYTPTLSNWNSQIR